LRTLEAGIKRNWGAARQDAALSHRVTRKALRQWARVGELTEWVALSRLRYPAIDVGLYAPPESLTPRSRRILLELAKLTRMPDRLEFVDDQIQVYDDLYHVANDRLSEYRYHRTELQMEALIVILLVMEAAVMIIEIISRLATKG
jgi:hypothetical protein